MSATELRAAAAGLRAESMEVRRPLGRDEHFKLAVADWLEDALDAHLHVRSGNYPSYLRALAVARAYLQEGQIPRPCVHCAARHLGSDA